jgi:S1/P1 Nuclease
MTKSNRISGFWRSLFLLAWVVPSAWSWGEWGHRVVAKAAIPYLSQEAKAEIARLLGPGDDLISIATWADEIRAGRPETKPWHYITMQVRGSVSRVAQADTPNVWTALLAAQNALVLAPGKKDPLKSEALRWFVHLMADAHQPLHAGEDHDKGGNETWIRLGRRKVNWHSAWDSGILEKQGWSEKTLASQVETQIRELKSKHPDSVQALSEASFEKMIEESHQLARQAYHGPGTPIRGRGRVLTLDARDVAWADSVNRRQLARAAIRLAYQLNRAFSKNPPAGFSPGPLQKLPPPSHSSPRRDYGLPEPSEKRFIWSRHSRVYHLRGCTDAARIAPKNLQSANTPPAGMKLHQGCPK